MPQGPTLETNELAKERNRAAADRTLLAWTINALMLMGIGFAFEAIEQALGRSAGAIAPWTGVGFMAAGLGVLALALAKHRLLIRAIAHQPDLLHPMQRLNQVTLAGVFLFSLVALAVLLLWP
jgi:putative membrane protein